MRSISLRGMKGIHRTNCWKPYGKVWYKKNEDFSNIKTDQLQADKNITAITKSDRFDRIKKKSRYK